MRQCLAVALFSVVSLTGACARPAPRFSIENAHAHVAMLAGTIGTRPVGTEGNARARLYVADQLRLYGFDVRVQEMDARRPEIGRTAHVSNIIAVKGGPERDAIGIVSHYDSVPEAPGAADDAFGVAVALEAARVLGARTERRRTLMVLVTDGEEAGLMGAAALTADREVKDRLKAYVNLEAIGSAGNAFLFESGPGNGWIVKPWAKSAPHPRGVSWGIEVYRRLPNDTDFSILKRLEAPGLNFAPIGDSYAYHTARDTPDRLSADTLRLSGETIVQTVDAMDAIDLSARSTDDPTFFDIGGTVAVAWGPVAAWGLAIAALVCGVFAWVKVAAACIRERGLGRWALSFVWSVVGAALVIGAMVGGTWALRAAREVYHPWYAHPDRLFVFLLAAGCLAGWCAMRLGAWLPRAAHGPRPPALVWSVTLPVWIALAAMTSWLAPSAAFLWTLPLLVAAIGLLIVRVEHAISVRAISVVVLAVSGTLWLNDTAVLLRFVVAILGRLPVVSPVYVYAVIMGACGVMVAPPFIGATAATEPLIRPSLVTAVLLVVTVVTGGFAYAAPAYTFEQPLRRRVRVLTETDPARATWEVASVEPGLDLQPEAPGGWYRASDVPQATVPWGRLPDPFVFRTTAPSPGSAPAAISAFTLKPVAGGTELTMTVTPQSAGLAVAFTLPDGVKPARSNLPGVVRAGRWAAVYIGAATEGVTWRASFPSGRESRLGAARAVVTTYRFPGGEGWQRLPSWLPQDHAVWTATASWVLTPPPAIALVPPLR